MDELEHWHGGHHNQLLCEFVQELWALNNT
jgi:hypothetical protein